jgi:hypothetical protein
MRRYGYLLWVLLLLMVAACGTRGTPYAKIPAFLGDAPAPVIAAYQYAMTHQHELSHIPCYCGCQHIHKNNWDCYIAAIKPDGGFEFDIHAENCGICVEITQDVMRLQAEGKTLPQIRAYIDSVYSERGPATDTPLPVS